MVDKNLKDVKDFNFNLSKFVFGRKDYLILKKDSSVSSKFLYILYAYD